MHPERANRVEKTQQIVEYRIVEWNREIVEFKPIVP